MGLPIYPASAITTEGKNALELGRRFRDDLEKFGIDDAFLADLEATIREAVALPDDQFVRIDLRSATDAKDDIRDECIEYVLDFRTRLDLGFGRASHEYARFPNDQLDEAKHDDGVMMDLMETIIRLSEKHQKALARVGLTPAVIQEGKDLLQDFQDADADQEIKKVERPATTVERHDAHQRVYDLSNVVLKAGRRVFKDNPTIYKLFRSPWTKYRRKPAPVEAEIPQTLDE